MRVSVIGTGYLGAVQAACLAELGHAVLGVDADPDKVTALRAGRAPFFEPGLDDMLAQSARAGRLRFGTSVAEAARFADVHFICVGTPQEPDTGAADLSDLLAAVSELAPHLARPCLVVGKSTVPVGTAARLAGLLAGRAPASAAARLAWNPEFLREGLAIQDTLRPDRLVIGTASAADEAALRLVYAPLLAAGTPLISTDLATAELVKAAANAFLATKISFINAMADVCEAAAADVTVLADALGRDARIGRTFLTPGLGFGGSCLPKDIRALQHRAAELGVGGSLRLLREVDEINAGRRRRAVRMAEALAGGSLRGQNVAVLGAAFKPATDDVRDSPALDVAAAIHAAGATVRVHDPRAADNARALFPALDYAQEPEKACADADLVLHLTEWPEYQRLDPAALGGVVRARRILDGRCALDLARWRAAGWTARSLAAGR